MHKNIEFEETKVEEGVNALRRLVASETLENLMTLSKNRSELVGKILTYITNYTMNL